MKQDYKEIESNLALLLFISAIVSGVLMVALPLSMYAWHDEVSPAAKVLIFVLVCAGVLIWAISRTLNRFIK